MAKKRSGQRSGGTRAKPVPPLGGVTLGARLLAALALLLGALLVVVREEADPRIEAAAALRPQRRGDAGPAGAGEELLEWATGRDGFVLNVELREFAEEGRGLVAKRTVKAGQLLLFVPAEYMLSVPSPEPGSGVSRYAALAAELLREVERGEASRHYHYIRGLPKLAEAPPNLPVLSPALRELMAAYSGGMPSGSVMRQRIEEGLGCADDVTALLSAEGGLPVLNEATSYSTAAWACSMILSREFSTGWSKRQQARKWWPFGARAGSSGGELWPIHDMLNHQPGHSHGAQTGWQHVFEHRGVPGNGLRASRDFKPGEQIYDQYGLSSDTVLLGQYGFALPSNTVGSIDVIKVPMPLPDYSWLERAPSGSIFNHCSGFLKHATSGRRQHPMLKAHMGSNTSGFDPSGLDCTRMAMYGYTDTDAFASALRAGDFQPLCPHLRRALGSISDGSMLTVDVIRKNAKVDEELFESVRARCAAYAVTFNTPRFREALVAAQDAEGFDTLLVRTLRQERDQTIRCVREMGKLRDDAVRHASAAGREP